MMNPVPWLQMTNMISYQGLVRTFLKWLEVNDIPYDEIYVGKPWCGHEGFYVDDKAIRPSEFINYSYDEIVALLRKEK